MRKVLANHHQVAHYWANKVQSEGAASRVFFEGDFIYSYGKHFCIARHLPSGAVAFTTRGYSSSTGKHKGIVRNAISGKIVYCDDPAASPIINQQATRTAIIQALADADKPRIRQATRDKHKAHALHLAEQFNAYLSAYTSPWPEGSSGNVSPIDVSSLGDLVEAKKRADAEETRRAEQRAIQRAADALQQKREAEDNLTIWRASAAYIDVYTLRMLPVALRLSEDSSVIQTSHGAEIPVKFARRLWDSVKLARSTACEYVPNVPMNVGVYRLNRIRANGSIVVGCHDIPYSELESMAIALGFTASLRSDIAA